MVTTMDVSAHMLDWLAFCGLETLQLDYDSRKKQVDGFRVIRSAKSVPFADGACVVNLKQCHWVALASPSRQSSKRQREDWEKPTMDSIRTRLKAPVEAWNR